MVDDFIVTDRASFIEFLEMFRRDLALNPHKWENATLENFLEAMARYTEDIQGYYDNKRKSADEAFDADVPTWQRFADILRGAKVYE